MKKLSALSLSLLFVIGTSQLAFAQKDAEAQKAAREGSEAAKAGNWDKAIEEFRKAAESDKKHNKNLAIALQQRGTAEMTAQKWPEAMKDFSEAIRLEPKNAAVYERRAYVEMKQGENDKALADYTEAIKLSPEDPRYYSIRAYLYELKQDYKNSMADTEKVLKLDKDNAEAKSRKERIQKIESMQAQTAMPGSTPIANPNTPTPTPTPKGKGRKHR